jgi:integrase/recombinase XerD
MSVWKYKRKDSPYFWIGFYDPATGSKGKPYSTKTRNAKLADLQVKEKERQLERQRNEQIIVKPAASGMLFSEAFELYKQDRRNSGKALTEGTEHTYGTALNYLYAACGNKAIYKYTRDDFYKFAESMNALKHNTKSTNASKINAIFRFLTAEKYLKENPFRRIAPKQKEFRVLDDKEVKRIRDYAHKTMYGALVDFQLLTAFRIAEALSVNAKNIKHGRILVDAKGGGMRAIPVSAELQSWLDKYFKDNDIARGSDTKLFNFSYQDAQFFWHTINKDLELGPGVASHALRKYALTKMANSGVPIQYVKEYAGHADIKTTMQYYIKNDMDKMADELNKKVVFLDDKV